MAAKHWASEILPMSTASWEGKRQLRTKGVQIEMRKLHRTSMTDLA
jgi:hypothetical protein